MQQEPGDFGRHVSVNRAYKDTLFRDLFGNPDRKEYTLSLYNALAGTHYVDTEALELTTIEGILYLGYKNDVSFVLAEDMVLWEHQSTPNPNMPVRGLMYFAQLYRRYIDASDQSELSSRRLELPTPRYYVFYNGTSERPEREVLRLSDSFGGRAGDVEVTVTVLNVNEGKNSDIMDACRELRGYAHLTALFREFVATKGPRAAMDAAVDSCVHDGFLVDYLRLRRSEVIDMLLTQWKEEEYHELLRREAYEDAYEEARKEVYGEAFAKGRTDGFEKGREDGFEKGREDGYAKGQEYGLAEGFTRGAEDERARLLERARELVSGGKVSAEAAAAILEISPDELADAVGAGTEV